MYIKSWAFCSNTPGHRQRCGGFTALRACHPPRDDGFAKFSRKFFENVGAINFFEKQISSTRSIWSKNRQNPSYPRDFSAVRSFGVPKKSNFRKAVYPPRMAPFGLKLWENAFQTIPNISFFDAEKFFLAKIFDENFRQKKISSENRQTACFCGAMDFWT